MEQVQNSVNHTANLPPEEQTGLAVILVCWNNKDYLEACLGSLFEVELSFRLEVVVVDNGSTDGSQAMLREKFPEVSLIQNDENVGLSRASNQGIRATVSQYILLLNNDTIVDGESLEAMFYFLESHPEAGVVGGTLLNPDGSVQATYGTFSTLGQEFLIATGLGRAMWPNYPDHNPVKGVQPVDWLSSACLMVRRDALDAVGLLDEDYFIYGDEADLQYRLVQNGWKVYHLPQATTIHFGGRSMNRWSRRKMVYRGKMLFYKKNYGAMRTLVLRAMLGVLSLFKIAFWGVVRVVPSRRDRARKEIASNRDVVSLCLRLQ